MSTSNATQYLNIRKHLDDLRFMNEDVPNQLWVETLQLITDLEKIGKLPEPSDIEFGAEECECEDGEYLMSELTLQWPDVEIMIAFHDSPFFDIAPIGCSVYGLVGDDFIQVIDIETIDVAIEFMKQHGGGKQFNLDSSGYLAFNV